MEGFGLRVEGFGLRRGVDADGRVPVRLRRAHLLSRFAFQVSGPGFWIWGSGFSVWGCGVVGFRVEG